jgi:hypothetical protein
MTCFFDPRRDGGRLVDHLSLERRIESQNAVGERWMRCEGRRRHKPDPIAEVQMAGDFGVRGLQLRTAVASNPFQRPGDAERVAGELNGRGVGQVFALSGNGGFDQPSEDDADPADDVKTDAEDQQRQDETAAVFFRIRTAARTSVSKDAKQKGTGQCNDQNAVDETHQP